MSKLEAIKVNGKYIETSFWVCSEFLFLGFLALLVCNLSGCAVAAIGTGIAAVKYANSKKKESYNEYALGMEKINLDREKANLPPKHIMSPVEYEKSKA